MVELASKEYNISSPLKLYNNITLKGQHKFNTKIISNGNIPTIVTEGFFKRGKEGKNITIENLGVYPRGVTKKDYYAIEMVNTYNSNIKNCYINELVMTKRDLGGIRFSKDSAYKGPHFVNNVQECQLQNASIVMESTDSYIQKNEIWADKRSFAIHLLKSSQFVTSNQIVGSNEKGALWIEDTKDNNTIDLLRIEGNYFDGSYDSVDSGMGINATNLQSSRIIGNDFWRLMDEGIKLTDSHSVNISSNNFSNNNRRDAEKSDILLTNCSACVTFGNTFTRDIEQQQKGSAIKSINSLNANIFQSNVVYDSSFYKPNSFSNVDIEK